LNFVLKKQVGMAWGEFIWLGIGKVADCCEHDNEILGFIKYGKLLESLKNYQLVKNDSAPWSWPVK